MIGRISMNIIQHRDNDASVISIICPIIVVDIANNPTNEIPQIAEPES